MNHPLLLSVLTLSVLAGVSACSSGLSPDPAQSSATASSPTGPAATPKAACGPGSLPETGLQGRVSRDDATSGRNQQGYTCNTQAVGSYVIANEFGSMGGFRVHRYVDSAGHDCAYFDSTLLFPTSTFALPDPSNPLDAQGGVYVLDMSDPTKPKLTAKLQTPAMLSPHESLVISKQRGVLAAVMGNPAFGPGGIVDVYDISQDCRSPVLKASAPVGFIGHEGGMSPDGKTFYSASATFSLAAVDISNLSLPTPITIINVASHGLTLSADGNRAYAATIGQGGFTFNGLTILDTSDIQARKTLPQFKTVSQLTWPSISIPQNAIPFTRNGHPYLVEIDEYKDFFNGTNLVGAGRIIDIADEKNPKVISNLRLEVHQPENFSTIANDPGANIPVQGYAGHYCNVPTQTDPTIVACSMIISGLRVFDIRDPANPREVAYFNAPVKPRQLPVPEASNWAMSQPTFVPERKEIWYTDGLQGFFAVRVTNGAWPTN